MHRAAVIFSLLAVLALAAPAWAGPVVPDCCSPRYKQEVMQSLRQLQYKMSIYGQPPQAGRGLRLGVYQAAAAYGPGALEKNMRRLVKAVEAAAAQGVQLLSFPELYTSGYTMTPAQARQVAQSADGPLISRCQKIAAQYKMALIVPYAEKAKGPDGKPQYFDSIAAMDAKGRILANYRKTHLWGKEERANWSFGDKLCPVFKVNGLPMSLLNCYECEFPELSRILALRGAKLIVGPTAADCYDTAPDGKRSALPYPDISRNLIPAYAYANNIFFAYSNHCGYESLKGHQWHYRGNSIIAGPHGDVIVAANHQQDTLLVADLIPGFYGATHPESNYLKDRRPKLYKELVAPRADFLPGGWVYPQYRQGREIIPPEDRGK
ncbi:MAG: carbon-nitrogen hydrolase family protein [Desulfarculaceae bacterium]|nr:carbon-nitrogen hydrolase family protein [Desulfarculaceae bacterium]